MGWLDKPIIPDPTQGGLPSGGGGGTPQMPQFPGWPSQTQGPGYLPASYGGSGGIGPDARRCCEDKICQCLSGGINSIASSTARIAAALEKKLDDNCDVIDKCFDKIVDKLRQKFEGPLHSAEQCRNMAAQGLGGTFEYAIRCAGQAIEKCDSTCSMSEGETDGKCCKGCGQEKCCCKDNACVPCPDDKKDDKKYIGWCNRTTGSVMVTKQGEPGPGVDWEQVALSETEQGAIAQANANCDKTGDKIYIPDPGQSQVGSYGVGACSFATYQSGMNPLLSGANYSIIQAMGAEAQSRLASGQLGVGGLDVNNVGQMIYGLVRYFSGSEPYIAQNILPKLADAFGCQNPNFTNAIKAITEFGYVNKSLGVDLSQFYQPWVYTANAACPTLFLDVDKSITAYLGGSIDKGALHTLWRMNGVCDQATEWYSHAARSKPIQLQLSMLRRRKIITPDEYSQGMRELGYIEPEVRENLFTITEQIPTLSDIIRFMVRDADDTTGVVAKFDLDAKFTEKYRPDGQLRKWSEWQGISEETARYAWRSHWSIPSPTQLFHFFHRLRKNDKYPKLLDDIKDAMIQQDILPFWHDHYLATSFLPIGRIDIRRAYNIGAIKDDELVPLYSQLGYSDETSETLSKFTRRLRDAGLVNHSAVKQWVRFAINRATAEAQLRDDGIPGDAISKALSKAEPAFESSALSKSFLRGQLSRPNLIGRLTAHGVSHEGATAIADRLGLRVASHPALADFVSGVIADNEARAEMTAYGMDIDLANSVIDDATRKVNASFVVQCQRGIKRRYLSGDIDKGEARNELIARGTSQQRAAEMVRWFDCEMESRGKAVAASKLCDWLARGAISAVDFRRRLVNIGYTQADASLMVEDCLIAISAKRLKEAEKQAKDDAAEQSRRQRAIAKAGADLQREITRRDRLNESMRKARLNRDKQFLSAVEKLTDKYGGGLSSAHSFLKDAKSRIQRDYALHVDEALQVLIKSVEDWEGGDLSTLPAVVDAMALAVRNSGNPPEPDRSVYSTNGNGSTHPSG